MAKKRTGVVSDLEIPNPGVFEAAQDFHRAARMLFRGAGLPPLLLPFYTVGGFALEAYLKSLNAPWKYPNLSQDANGDFHRLNPSISPSDEFVLTAEPATISHDLVELFDGLNETFRVELATKYAEDRILPKEETFVSALERFKNAFVHSRYIFEYQMTLPVGPLDDLLRLLDFLGNYVEGKHKRNPRQIAREQVRAKFGGEDLARESRLPETKVDSPAIDQRELDLTADIPPLDEAVYFGRIDGNAVLLDSGEFLIEETIVGVEPVQGAPYGEVGVVADGVIRLQSPGSIADQTPVKVEILGRLLGVGEVAPFYKIGELANDPNFADLEATTSPRPEHSEAGGR